MVTDMYNFSFSIIEVEFDSTNTENDIFLSSVCLKTDLNSITVPMSVKVIIAFGAFKRNESLKCLI